MYVRREEAHPTSRIGIGPIPSPTVIASVRETGSFRGWGVRL